MATVTQKLFGRILKIHGCEGAVSVRTEKIFYDNIPEMESVFLEIEGRQVPFFIEQYQSNGHENVLLWFRDYNTVEKVKEFIGCRVFIISNEVGSSPVSIQEEIIGFELRNKEKEIIGRVKEVIENPGQWLLTVKANDGSEILIPFHEDLLISIDNTSKVIIMDLPAGLNDLNRITSPSERR